MKKKEVLLTKSWMEGGLNCMGVFSGSQWHQKQCIKTKKVLIKHTERCLDKQYHKANYCPI